ncbi:MAG: type II CRISPR RNA-guided endonuclease Cas9 [Armatimonadota bacterium]
MFQVGLDLGTNSVGWAIVAYSDAEGHVAAGSYVFPEAGEEKGGKFVSNQRQRGDKRRQRKQLRRKKQRKQAVLRLLVGAGLLPKNRDERERVLTSTCPYRARAEALHRALEPHELACAIFHIAKRRGYLSTAALKLIGISNVEELDAKLASKVLDNADSETDEAKEVRGLLDSIAETRRRIQRGEARTLGELMFKEIQARRAVRAITGKRITEPIVRAVRRAVGEKRWAAMDAKTRNSTVEGMRRLAALARKPERTEGDETRLSKLLDTLAKGTELSREEILGLSSLVRPEVRGVRADRKLYHDEFDAIVEAQRPHHPNILTDEFCERLREALFYQRPLKPTSNLVGFCSILPNRKRCHNATMLAQHSILLQRLNTIKVVARTHEGVSDRRLAPEEIRLLLDALDRSEKLPWDEAAEIVGLAENEWFDENPPEDGASGKRRRKKTSDGLVGNRTCTAMRKAIGDKWDELSNKRKEELIHRVLTARRFKDIAPGLEADFGLSGEEIYSIATANLPEGHNRHSAKVLRKIEPFLRRGHVYSEALELAGFREPHKSTEQLPSPADAPEYASTSVHIANPVVRRAVKNALVVLNEIIKKHGRPEVVRVELPRDVARTNKQREKVIEAQERRKRLNEKAKTLLEDAGLPATPRNILKVRLWQEAGGRSPYAPEHELTIRQVVEECDIDHIIPRSRSLDDSFGNLTICPNRLNLAKGDKTPFEAFGSDDAQWSRIRTHLGTLKSMGRRKKALILTESPDTDGFVGRDFSDTSYIAREVKKAIQQLGIKVEVTRGALTAELRKLWGLDEILPLSDDERQRIQEANEKGRFKNRDDHRHHALDAVITALMDIRTQQRLTAYYKQKETTRAKGIELPAPWSGFKDGIRRVIDGAPVVFQPTRGIDGALHEDTARTPPPPEAVERAIAQLPEHRRERIERAVVVGSQLVYLDDDGEPLAAYDLGSNHHCIIWQRKLKDKKGRHRRELEVVTMIEAATRAACGEPVFSADLSARGPEWEPFLFLCKNDIVEYDHPQHGRCLMRVAKFSVTEASNNGIMLRPIRDAREIKEHNVTVKSQDALARVLRRVILSPLGDEIGSEPHDAEHQ